MTSKLKCPVCPWCNQPKVLQDDIFVCANTDCSACAESFLHKALIQAKQDLEIVVDALKPFADRNNWDFEHCFVDAPQLLAETALAQIEHKE